MKIVCFFQIYVRAMHLMKCRMACFLLPNNNVDVFQVYYEKKKINAIKKEKIIRYNGTFLSKIKKKTKKLLKYKF